MRRRAWCATVTLAAVLAGCSGGDPEDSEPERPGPGLHELTFTSEGGSEHPYLLYVPPGHDPGTPIPLVFVFHGRPGSAYGIAGTTTMHEVAEQEDFLVAYPDGMAESDPVRELAGELLDRWNVASGAVYATGFSAGGSLSMRLGIVASDTFAAVASVGGPSFTRDERPDAPVSVLGVIGLSDSAWLDGFDEGLQEWRKQLDCATGEPTWVDEDEQTSRSAASCDDGSEVVEYRVTGMPHRWPAAVEPGQDTSQTIWEFFADHRRG